MMITNSIFVRLLTLVATLPLLVVSVQATAATFSVTAKDCATSPGGYEWAIEQANNSPGHDIISIDVPVFTVSSCTHIGNESEPPPFTESVDIVGNGNWVVGNYAWIDTMGNLNPLNQCPPGGARWLNKGGSLISVGEPNADASGIEVAINNLNMDRLITVGSVRRNAKLTIEDSRLENIWSISECNAPIISAKPGADLTLRRTSIVNASVPASGVYSIFWPVTTALIHGGDSGSGEGGDLIMENVTIDRLWGDNSLAVWWNGGSVKVVSSAFYNSHGFWLENITADFVNSVYSTTESGHFSDNFLLGYNAVLNSEASTFVWANFECQNCNITKGTGSNATRGLGFLGAELPSVRFKSTALGSIVPQSAPLEMLWGNDPKEYESDALTWVQPTVGQDAFELAAILPSASTATPGLPNYVFGPVIVREIPVLDGVLVEVVPNAGPGGINELFSPIDGSPITVDVNGVPRVYANGTRNIGAVQNGDATIISATPGDSQVTLDWSPTMGGQLGGYELCASSTPLIDPLIGNCPGTLTSADKSEMSKVIDGLTNGAEYWFAVRGAGEIWSMVATATPMGPLGIAQPTAATIGDGSVQVYWAEPTTTGGHIGLLSYSVVYRPLGTQTWLFGPQGITPRTTLLSSLVNGTTYEIGVSAQTDDGGLSPMLGTITATPQAAPTLGYATPSSWPQNTPLTLTPTVGQLQGAGAYTIESGALPDGLTLNPSTGVISGTPVTQQNTSATILLTDGITGLFTSVTLPLSIFAPSPEPQLYYPEIQATVGIGPVSATPTQSGIPAGAVWSVYPSHNLPAGFALDSVTGIISGTPTTPPGKVVDITIQACWDGCDPNAGEVSLAPMLFFIVPNLQYPASTQATAGVAATVTPTVSLWSGGVFGIESGSMPTGMSLDPVTGVISGTPQTESANLLTISYSTGVNVTVPPLEHVYSVTQINVEFPTITLTYPAVTAYVGENLSVSPSVSGVTNAAVYSTVSSSLPQGLSLNPTTGVITGVPTGTPGVYPVVIEVTDTYGSQRTSLIIDLLHATDIPTLSSPASALLAILLTLMVGWVRSSNLRRR